MNITSSSDLTLDEMTEASDRIYQEVGDDAEIIWGQTFDETLGDEIRITVIATGIGAREPELAENMHRFEPPAASATSTGYSDQAARSQAAEATQPWKGASDHPGGGPIARGRLRTPTEEELSSWNEFDNPVRVTHKRVVGGDDIPSSWNETVFDNDNLEVPTFLRRKAD
jgi:cell division protein FtsZ